MSGKFYIGVTDNLWHHHLAALRLTCPQELIQPLLGL
jgi:hypothetical protein